MGLKRCFLAVPLPEETKKNLIHIQGRLRDHMHSGLNGREPVKWVEAKNLHLTLKFFGDISDKQIEYIKEELARELAEFPSFMVTLTRLGAFPNLQKPNVLWIGVRDDTGGLTDLHEISEDISKNAGLARDRQHYRPHLTLGRVRRGHEDGLGIDFSSVQGEILGPGPTQIGEVILYESKLLPTGPVYRSLVKFPLSSS